jgi:hypothetical protein
MRAWFLNVLLIAAAALSAASAQATPITYLFAGGQVTITATVGGTALAPPKTVLLTGTSVVLNEPVQLTNVNLAMGASGTIALSPSYLGFTSVNIDFATLTAALGTLTLFDPGSPKGYNYAIGPVAVAGQFDAVNVNPINTLTNQPFGFSNSSASGQVYVDTGVQIALDGITIGEIDPDGPGGAPPLVLKGDFLFEATAAPIPEPGTALLLGLGIAGVAARRRARAS